MPSCCESVLFKPTKRCDRMQDRFIESKQTMTCSSLSVDCFQHILVTFVISENLRKVSFWKKLLSQPLEKLQGTATTHSQVTTWACTLSCAANQEGYNVLLAKQIRSNFTCSSVLENMNQLICIQPKEKTGSAAKPAKQTLSFLQ